MSYPVTIHLDNADLVDPHLWIEYAGSDLPDDLPSTGKDDFGPVFAISVRRPDFTVRVKQGPGAAGPWENPTLTRIVRQHHLPSPPRPAELWCRADKPFVYPSAPRRPEAISAAEYLARFPVPDAVYLPSTDGPSGLGATVLTGGGTLFGLYHPNAGRVFVAGTFNDWQHPGRDDTDPDRFRELALYRGYFGVPNLWLGVAPDARPGHEYKFVVEGARNRRTPGRCAGGRPTPSPAGWARTTGRTTVSSSTPAPSPGPTAASPPPTGPTSSCTSSACTASPRATRTWARPRGPSPA